MTQKDEASSPTTPPRHVVQDDGGAFLVERAGERLAEMTYAMDGQGRAVIDHTWVSPALRGEGTGLALLRAAVDWARRDGVRVVPVCSFARAAFARHEELADVLA